MVKPIDEKVKDVLLRNAMGGSLYLKGLTPEVLAGTVQKSENQVTSSLKRLKKKGEVIELRGVYTFPSGSPIYESARIVFEEVTRHPNGISEVGLLTSLIDDLTMGDIYDGLQFLLTGDQIQKVEVYNPTLRQYDIKYRKVTERDRILRKRMMT